MKNIRKSRTVWMIVDDQPYLSPLDRRRNVVHFIHYNDPESGRSMFTHSGEESPEGAMEFTSEYNALDYARTTLRGHHNRALKAVQVTVTESYKFA